MALGWRRVAARRVVLAATLVVAPLALGVPLGAGAAGATTPSITASWLASSSESGARTVVYTWVVRLPEPLSVSAVSFTVPQGTRGPGTIHEIVGLGAGALVVTGATATYEVASPVPLAAGSVVTVALGGATNPDVPGAWRSTVEVYAGGSQATSAATTNALTFGAQGASATVTVPASATIATEDPTRAGTPGEGASSTERVEVWTNVDDGYVLNVWATSPGRLAPVEGKAALGANQNHAALQGPYSSGGYARYATGAPGEIIVRADEPTGRTPDELVLTNLFAVGTTPKDVPIVVVVTPSY